MFAVKKLTKRFGANTACDAVSFAVDAPKMIGIIGRSGAGKSTLLRMLNRLTDATSGEVVYEGRDILTLKGAAARAWQSRLRDDLSAVQSGAAHGCGLSNVLHGTLNRRSTLATMFNLYPRGGYREGASPFWIVWALPIRRPSGPRPCRAVSSSAWRLRAR